MILRRILSNNSHITFLLAALCLMFSTSARAHEIRPAVADVSVTADAVEMSISLTLEPLIAGINLVGLENTNDAPEALIYDQLRAQSPEALRAAFEGAWPRIQDNIQIIVNGVTLPPEFVGVSITPNPDLELPRDTTLTLRADLPMGDAPVQIGWSASYGELVLRQVGGGADAYQGFLTNGELSAPLPRGTALSEGAWPVFTRYVVAGFEHIIPLGIDHILFVLGLFFFSLRLKPLLLQVSAFTLAHTITLALASLEIVRVPASVVEPLIAASIVYVGVENILGRENLRARTALVFGFGLLHGLGFASVLGDFGITADRFGVALVGFNIGVEFGQLAVIGLAFLAVGLWFGKRDWYRPFIAIPASVVISAIGAYWVVERTLL